MPTHGSIGSSGTAALRATALRRKLADVQMAKARAACLLHPDQRAKMYWDTLLAALVVYSILIVPYRIGLGSGAEVPPTNAVFWWEVAIDFFFLADVVVNFCTATYKRESSNEIELSRWRIAVEYGRTWFLIDLSSSIPIDLIMLGQSGGGGESVKLLKMLKASASSAS